jgi:hypothetical protein
LKKKCEEEDSREGAEAQSFDLENVRSSFAFLASLREAKRKRQLGRLPLFRTHAVHAMRQ